MGQILTHHQFLSEPVTPPPMFRARQVDVARQFGVATSTIRRWEYERWIWERDDEHPDGHYIRLPSGRKRYDLERVRTAILQRN